MEIFALIISPSLFFSQHTSAQKTVDELGFDQGKGHERINVANTVPAGFSGQLSLTAFRSLNEIWPIAKPKVLFIIVCPKTRLSGH